MHQGVRTVRRVALVVVALLSVAVSIALISSQNGPIRLSGASTFDLFSVLGLLLLPVATLTAIRLDSQWTRQRARHLAERTVERSKELAA